MNARFALLLAPLVLSCALAHAQTALQNPAPGAPAARLEAQNPGAAALAPTFARLRQLNQLGLYRQMIETATQALDKIDPTNRRLLYWRGLARRRLILLDDAKKDLQPLGDFTIAPQFPPASRLVEQADALLALRPQPQYLVRSDDGKVLYRVYCSEDDEFLHSILAALPTAYKTASAFTGAQTDEIPVFVFNNAHYPDFSKFFSTMIGHPMRNWSQSVTRSGTITLSQRTERSALGRPSTDPRMVRTLSHETTHQLMRGLVGMLVNTPPWFTEGMAQACEATIDPAVNIQNDKTMRLLVVQDAILPLDQIGASQPFYDTVTKLKDGQSKGRPYPQGLSMTRYLLTRLRDGKMSTFLQLVREKQDFKAALQEATGLTEEQFYQNWQKNLPTPFVLATPNPPVH